ncbi:MAG TPA: TetR/AcrR family transcriptional regulator [Polyangiaceae bacterium]|nr:TetR/AcrR family transcriptional regulator [Polyangiaceae bacterium]
MTMHKRRKKTDHRTRVGRERSARTETRILEAALGVFADMGPDAPKIEDFAQAAGISRGTFYNYFESVEELLAATSEWMTRELLESIETMLEGLEGPALRLGVGLRLFFAKAQADPVWCRFVGRVWKVGGVELPTRDVEEGFRLGVFHAPSVAVARDLLFGGVREALLRIGNELTPPAYGEQMTELCLQALGTDARRIAAVMKHELPSLPSDAPRHGAKTG